MGKIKYGVVIFVAVMGLMTSFKLSTIFAGENSPEITADEENDKSEEIPENEDVVDEIKIINLEEILKVNIATSSGLSVILREGKCAYTNEALSFKCDNEFCGEGEVLSVNDYYSMSYDGGNTFSEKEAMDNGIVSLNAVSDGAEYYLRFYRTERVLAEDVYIDYVSESDIYHVIFDRNAPQLYEESAINWDEWVNYKRTALFKTVDDSSGISRVIVKDKNDGILYEYHFEGQSAKGDSDIEFGIELDKAAFDESGEKIVVGMTDMAGNYSESEYCYYCDFEMPRLSINGVSDKSVNSKIADIQFLAEDNIPTGMVVNYEIQRDSRGMKFPNIAKELADIKNGDSVGEKIVHDGIYNVIAVVKDRAGNESNRVSIRFRIDTAPPILKIEGFENGADYNRAVGGRIYIDDDFFYDTTVDIRVTKKTPKGEENYITESFNPEGYEYQKYLNLHDDGDYHVTVHAVDAAGNYDAKEAYVRVDKTAPFITISGLIDRSITKEKPELFITVKELFFDSAKVQASMYKISAGGLYEPVLVRDINPSEESDSFFLNVNDEGSYMLKVSAADRAGNYSESNIQFELDFTAPKIGWIDTINKKYFKSILFPARFAANINDAHNVSYNAYINTENLREGSEITKDGKYIIRIIAVDEAGNVSDEKAEFIIDTRPPKIVVSGLNQKGNIKKGDVIKLSLYDSDDYFEYAKMDGANIDITDNNKTCIFNIDSEGEHSILVRAVDFAGNITEKEFAIECASLTSPGGIREKVKKIERANIRETESQEVNTNKKIDEKYLYIIGALVLAVLTIGALILRGFRCVDTDI